MVMLTNRLPQQNNYTRPSLKPQNNNSGNVAFGEGFTQKFIRTFFPDVADKQDKIQKNVTKESNEALGLIGSLMAHHIDPKLDVEKKGINIEQSTTKPLMVTVDETKSTGKAEAVSFAQMNNFAVKPNFKPVVPNNAFQPIGQPVIGQKLNVVA